MPYIQVDPRILCNKRFSAFRGLTPSARIAHEIWHFLDLSGLLDVGFSSETSTIMTDWWMAATQSEGYRNLLKDDDYNRQIDETWARSYAQWLALHSNNEGLLAALRVRQSRDNNYWSDEDFEPIAQAIDSLMRTQKWTK
jgi:hypothetical protein